MSELDWISITDGKDNLIYWGSVDVTTIRKVKCPKCGDIFNQLVNLHSMNSSLMPDHCKKCEFAPKRKIKFSY